MSHYQSVPAVYEIPRTGKCCHLTVIRLTALMHKLCPWNEN
jgi:hypothetical protein